MIKTLAELGIISYGKDYKSNPKGDGDIPIIGTGGLMGYTTIPLNSGKSVLTGRKGSINSPRYIEGEFWNVDTIFCIKAKEEVSTKWLYYNLLNTDLTKLNEATGVPSVNSASLYKLKFKYFDYETQTKIAKILTTIDNVIEKTEEAIAKYEAIKQGMMHDLFTRGIGEDGKLRRSFEDAPELYKESVLGWIPNEWEVDSINNVSKIKASNVDKKKYIGQKKVVLCNYMDVYNNRFIKNGLPFMESTASFDEIRKFKLKLDDVIITKDSETPFDIAIPTVVVEELENTICGYHLSILQPLQEKIKGTFLMYNLCLPIINRQFMRKANGSTRYGLTKDTIETANIFKPKLLEQNKIIERLNSVKEKIRLEKQILHKQTELKKGLMQDLLTGKVMVND